MFYLYKIKNKKIILVALIIAMGIILNACAKSSTEEVAALVNKGKIGMEEFDEEYKIQVNSIKSQLGEDILEQESPDGVIFKEELKKETLNRMIVEEIISQDAKKKDIEVSDDEMDKTLEEVREGMGGEEELNKYMESLGIDESYLEEYSRKIILLEKHKKNFMENLEIKDKEAKDFFEENKDELVVVKARHILVENEDKGNEILGKLIDGESFEKLALENSKDTETAQLGGDLGYFTRGHNPKDFDQVVFALKEGETSNLFKSEIGFHIVEVEEKKDTFKELKSDLINNLKENKYVEYLEKLQEDAKIEIFLEEMKKDK